MPANKFAAALLLLIFFCFAAQTPAFAQLGPADIERANQESERIQRERSLQQQKDSEQILRSRKPSTQIEPPAPVLPKGSGTACLKIKRVKIDGAERMNDRVKATLEQKYTGDCVGVNEIQSLMGEITAYYIDKGYSTTRAYLPEQDLGRGTLTVQVVEGKVSDIRLKEGDKGSLFIPNAFPGVKGDVLNLRDIEQALDQVNRLSSNNATMDIAPGENPGESVVVINNNPSKRWHLNAVADNYGTRTTGRNELGLTASLDSILGLNELFSLNVKKTLPINDPDKQSTSASALFSVPFGYYTLTGGYSDSNYNSLLVTPSSLIVDLSGNSHSYYATLDRVVYRNRDTKVKVSGTLTNKESNNYVAGARLAVSSRTLTVADLGVNASTAIGSGFANFGFGYSRGLTMLGAQQDLSGLPGSAPRAQFDKLTASASYFLPFRFHDQDMSFNTSATAQYGLDTLYGSEQFSVGGIYTVRGFYEESLANDHGILIRNDLSLTRRFAGPMEKDVIFKPYVAIDTGAVGSDVNKTPAGMLIGGAVGFSLSLGEASFDIYAGHPISAPDDVDNEGFNTFGRLSVNF